MSFYVRFAANELRRRRGRTLLTVLGLGVGVALVVTVSGLSRGLDRAQQRVLGPLASVGTDLVVTRTAQAPGGPQVAFGPGGFARGASAPGGDIVQDNASIVTDLSKLGAPGDRFSHDFFLPATQLTFPAEEAAELSGIDGVSTVAHGLTLLATHQEGTVPEIVTELPTGGETVEQEIRPEPMTEAERNAFQDCIREQGGFASPPPREGVLAGPPPEFERCLPERFRRIVARFTTPLRTLRQVLDPPSTDIESRTYVIAGVDTASPELGLLVGSQIAEGRTLRTDGEAVIAEAYAARRNLAPDGKLEINGTSFAIVGLATPPLGGQAADVYLTLPGLQKLSGRAGRVNVVFVRAVSADRVAAVAKGVGEAMPGADVADSEDVAAQVSGSLVDAARLGRSLGLALAVVALAAAFMIASLVTLSSVSKRVRELGTLKAIGWSQRLVVRQVVGESLAQGALGGIAGVVLGVIGALALSAFGPELRATAPAQGVRQGLFGLGAVAAAPATVRLTAPVDVITVVLAVVLALLGGLIAGALGGLRAARLRPADAMRQVG